MRIYEKRIFWLILIYVVVFIVGNFYFYTNIVEIKINFKIPLNSDNYSSFIWILLTSFGVLFGWLYKLDLQEEKEKHLGYIRTINDRIGKKIDGNFFTDISKVKKFCEKEEYYIVPYGYRFNVSSINNEDIVDTEEERTLLEIFINKISENFNYDILKEELKDYKEFINLEYFLERLSVNNKNTFKIKDNIIRENFINKNCFEENKDKILSFLDNGDDFIIIEGYYYLYKI